MCPTGSVGPSVCLFSLDDVLPVVVPFCDEGAFTDDEMIRSVPSSSVAVSLSLSPSRLSRPLALPSIDCSLLVTPPRKDSSDSLSPSTPDSGFSSDDGGPCLPRLERSKTLASALRKHRSSVSSRKSVRFADSLGLDLEKMEYFTRDDDNLFSHTLPNTSLCSPVASTTVVSHRLFPTNFVYRSESESIGRTRSSHVNISSLRTTHAGHLMGQINVLDVAYDKKITIRYTMDGWLSHNELSASFSHKLFGNEDIDAFSFVLAIPHQSSTRCEMCVSYSVSEGIFWDNNGGANYLLEWVAREEKPVEQTSHVLSRLPPSLRLSRFTRNESDDDLLSPIDKLPVRSTRKWVRGAGAKLESSTFV